MTRHSIISTSAADDNSAKSLTAADLIRMADEVDSKFLSIIFTLRNQYKSNAQAYMTAMDTFQAAFAACHSTPQQLALLNSWLKDGR